MSSKLIIGLMIIIAIAIGASFYSGASDQLNKGDLLSQKISNDTQNLKTISNNNQLIEAEITEISKKISAAMASLSSSQVALPEMVDSNVIVRKIISYGDKAGVTVIPLGTKEWAALNIDQNNYHVFKMSIEVNGPQQNVLDYIKQVQDTLDQYLVIERLEMSNNMDGGASTEPGISYAKINLDIALYAR